MTTHPVPFSWFSFGASTHFPRHWVFGQKHMTIHVRSPPLVSFRRRSAMLQGTTGPACGSAFTSSSVGAKADTWVLVPPKPKEERPKLRRDSYRCAEWVSLAVETPKLVSVKGTGARQSLFAPNFENPCIWRRLQGLIKLLPKCHEAPVAQLQRLRVSRVLCKLHQRLCGEADVHVFHIDVGVEASQVQVGRHLESVDRTRLIRPDGTPIRWRSGPFLEVHRLANT